MPSFLEGPEVSHFRRLKVKENIRKMNKKIIVGLGAAAAALASVAMFAAYEAHIINVTAHIENALYVHPDEIAFGTVFPQEYTERNFTVELSSSFQEQDRLYDVSYVIKQKPKCECDTWETATQASDCTYGQYAPVGYDTHLCPEGYSEMLSLCPFLSKVDGDPEDGNDHSHPSYYVDPDGVPNNGDEFCPILSVDNAKGVLENKRDILDLWIVDLKVPPIDGYVGQDWPEGCPTVAEDEQDYGCDLWIEVTGFSEVL